MMIRCILLLLALAACATPSLATVLTKSVPVLEPKLIPALKTVPRIIPVPKVVPVTKLVPKLTAQVTLKPLPKVVPTIMPKVTPRVIPKVVPMLVPKLGTKVSAKIIPGGRKLLETAPVVLPVMPLAQASKALLEAGLLVDLHGQ